MAHPLRITNDYMAINPTFSIRRGLQRSYLSDILHDTATAEEAFCRV